MNLEKIQKLINMFQEADISELEVEDDEVSICIKNETKVQIANQPVQQPSVPAQQEAAQTEQESEESEEATGNSQKIEAPMVGTFYRAPAPDADPFVDVGSQIGEGDTLCIIEAMKLMNEIEADTNGEIVEILVEDGESVEYGQPLFVVEPN